MFNSRKLFSKNVQFRTKSVLFGPELFIYLFFETKMFRYFFLFETWDVGQNSQLLII